MTYKFGNKRPGEAVTLTFNFARELPDGVFIASALESTVAVVAGADASFADRLDGAAASTPTTVLQRFSGGVVGTDYLVCARAVLSDGQLREMVAILPIRNVF